MLQIRLRKDPHEVSAQWYEKITRRRQGGDRRDPPSPGRHGADETRVSSLERVGQPRVDEPTSRIRILRVVPRLE